MLNLCTPLMITNTSKRGNCDINGIFQFGNGSVCVLVDFMFLICRLLNQEASVQEHGSPDTTEGGQQTQNYWIVKCTLLPLHQVQR